MADQLTETVPSPVSLVIPCRPEYVALCRLVAGALCARDGLCEEAVSDIKVIVTEACDCFLGMAPEGSRADGACGDATEGATAPGCSIRMEFDSRPDEFVISVLYPEKRELVSWLESRDPLSEAGLGLTILKALTDEMSESPHAEGTVLRLVKRLPE
jgi:hypothetical protein